MLLVFTASANNSDEIKKELALASQNRVLVIPVRAEDVLPGDAFRYELATRQWVDLFQDWDRGVSRLATQIQSALGEPVADPLPHSPPPATASGSRRLAIVALAGVALAGCAAVWFIEGRTVPPTPQPAPVVLTGTWVSELLTSPYASNEQYTLEADFQQQGPSLTGSVKEIDTRGGASKPIRDGHIGDGQISFYTMGEYTTGDATNPYRETYQGSVAGDALVFTRQNDTPTGGETEHFTLHRK